MCIQCVHCYAFDADVLWISVYKLHGLTETIQRSHEFCTPISQYVALYWSLFMCIKHSQPAKCKIVVV